MRLPVLAGALLILIAACSEPAPIFHESERPLRLSDWQLFDLSTEELTPSEASLVLHPSNQLFTDYAHKMRTLWIPQGLQAELVDEEIQYPVGTVISKTFYYPRNGQGQLVKVTDPGNEHIALGDHQLLETRLLVHRQNGWDAFPYVWNEEQTEAFLRVAGTSTSVSLQTENEDLDFMYFVPNENQCSGCHTTDHPDGEMKPLGIIASQLSSPISDARGDFGIQTSTILEKGWLNAQPADQGTISWRDESASLEDRALAYLNIHCAHCHNPEGAADTSGLFLDGSSDIDVSMGLCKPPVAAGGGAGDLQYSIVPSDPDHSILVYRMESSKPDEMMPELGRSLIHTEGVALIRQWISSMSGSC
ncbi:MAG: hypothetical protein HOF74_13260 [Gammaproteobacteria bacterium]|jgi:uncharacterized repeat protein (TIGR03806 family)|nr:hypothetical protein [Gammaproteobacteria bacterium]MBT3860794.1 hypothetical protein [Gammaproteobacteria bacterium]MBT3986951.1 hypothetical protein [Gammaproteobacteria bacterium]MBT4255045.1 hypothetical protein [Gammaproteobacteria bacterium]MBT4582068.1 hypothetical protein [Gammaproteobacteria bacterium]